MSTTQELLDAKAADCKARGVGMSACLESFRASDVGCDGTIGTTGPNARAFGFECHGVPNARKAAVLLAEAEARQPSSSAPWLILGGLVVAGLVVYAVTR